MVCMHVHVRMRMCMCACARLLEKRPAVLFGAGRYDGASHGHEEVLVGRLVGRAGGQGEQGEQGGEQGEQGEQGGAVSARRRRARSRAGSRVHRAR